MIHSGLPFFNPLLSVGGVAFPWALQTQTSPSSSPPSSPVSATRVSSFTIDAILGRRHHQQHHEPDASNNVARSLARRREERLSRTAPYSAPSGLSGPPPHHPTAREGSNDGSGNNTGGNGCSKAKAKRVRTIFTAEQLERLEAEFARQQYMVGPERLYLAAALQLTEAQVKVWFQNRRIKWRKAFMEQQHARLSHSPDEAATESVSLPSSPLRVAEESSSEEIQRVELNSERILDATSATCSTSATPSEPIHQTITTQFLNNKLSSDLQTRHFSEVSELTCSNSQ